VRKRKVEREIIFSISHGGDENKTVVTKREREREKGYTWYIYERADFVRDMRFPESI
jgi:hypothetical protein